MIATLISLNRLEEWEIGSRSCFIPSLPYNVLAPQLNDMKSFKEFRDSVESRLHCMKEAIIANGNVQKTSLLSDNGIEASLGSVVGLLKERIVFLENELKQKDSVIKILTKKLVEDNCQVVSKGIMLMFL